MITFGFCIIVLVAALFVLFTDNILYAAVALLVCLLGVSALFVLSGSEFLGASQILIYVGGILVLLIFGIVLSRNTKVEESNNQSFMVKLSALTLGILLAILGISTLKFRKIDIDKITSFRDIAISLMSSYIFLFELIGILLLLVLVISTYIIKKDD